MKSAYGRSVTGQMETLLTLPEVAKILRCSERTVRRLVESGRINAVKIGRRYRFRRQDLAGFVRGSLTTAPARSEERIT